MLPARYDDDDECEIVFIYICEIYMIWCGWVLWHINHFRFNAKSSLFIYVKYI